MVWQLLNKTALVAEGINDTHPPVHGGGAGADRAPSGLRTRFAASSWRAARVKQGAICAPQIFKFADLFVPEAYRDAVFGLCAAMCAAKAEIGLSHRVTA